MAKKNSIKVNIDDMFLSGTMDDPIKRKEVMNSPMITPMIESVMPIFMPLKM